MQRLSDPVWLHQQMNSLLGPDPERRRGGAVGKDFELKTDGEISHIGQRKTQTRLGKQTPHLGHWERPTQLGCGQISRKKIPQIRYEVKQSLGQLYRCHD